MEKSLEFLAQSSHLSQPDPNVIAQTFFMQQERWDKTEGRRLVMGLPLLCPIHLVGHIVGQ
jgi:hypothetical protein